MKSHKIQTNTHPEFDTADLVLPTVQTLKDSNPIEEIDRFLHNQIIKIRGSARNAYSDCKPSLYMAE